MEKWKRLGVMEDTVVEITTEEERRWVEDRFAEVGWEFYSGNAVGLPYCYRLTNNGCRWDLRKYYTEQGCTILSVTQLKEILMEKKSYQQGDVLVCEDGKVKVLGVCGEIYFLSSLDNFKKTSGVGYTIGELDEDYKLYVEPTPPEIIEETVESLERRLNMSPGTLRIKK